VLITKFNSEPINCYNLVQNFASTYPGFQHLATDEDLLSRRYYCLWELTVHAETDRRTNHSTHTKFVVHLIDIHSFIYLLYVILDAESTQFTVRFIQRSIYHLIQTQLQIFCLKFRKSTCYQAAKNTLYSYLMSLFFFHTFNQIYNAKR
jgi:hypothetical protein